MRESVIECPRCGSRELTLIAKNSQFENHTDLSPVRTIYVFRCECGVGFTHTVLPETGNRNENSSPSPGQQAFAALTKLIAPAKFGLIPIHIGSG